MPDVVILNDAHLLMQAEWIEDESQIAKEREEVLENFLKQWIRLWGILRRLSYLPVICFDYRTKSGQRVAHREGGKNTC